MHSKNFKRLLNLKTAIKSLCYTENSRLTAVSRLYLISFIGLFVSFPSYAYFCSGNGYNGYINVGDTEEKVIQSCGQPSTAAKKEASSQQDNTVQFWTYSNQKLVTNTNKSTGTITTNIDKSGPMVTLKIAGDKVTDISVDGRPVKTTNQCQTGRTISIGSSSSNVMLACGNPSGVTTSHANPTNSAQSKEKIDVWTYNYGNYRQPLVLEFRNGQLKTIKP